MMEFKITLFILIISSVRFIFINIILIGDKKISKMKEFIDFTDYLRIYSCDMKMPVEEILIKYNFKSDEFSKICYRFLDEIRNNSLAEQSNKSFLSYIENTAMTPEDFNLIFADIINYYGSTYSDVLDKKLNFTKEEMLVKMKKYEDVHKEKKELYNKVSLLFGCLAAVILI